MEAGWLCHDGITCMECCQRNAYLLISQKYSWVYIYTYIYTNADWNGVLHDGERKKMGIQMWNAIIRGGETKEMGIQMSITKRTHSWGKMYLFILFILWYDTNQEEGIFMCLPVSWSTHVYMMCVCVWWKPSCVFVVVGIFKSFLDYTEILKTFLDKNTSVGFLAIMEFMIFLYMYAFPSRFIYALAFSSDSCWRPVLLKRIRASFEQMYKYTHHPWPAFQ